MVRGKVKAPDISYQARYEAEEIAKYGPIPVEMPDKRTSEELEAMRRAVYKALGIRKGEI